MVLWTLADVPEQHGRIAVITGANSGLGEQAALALAGKGAHVVLACRNPAKAHAAEARIRQVHPAASVQVRVLDLADISSVAQFADGHPADHRRVDILLNNAGLMAVDAARTRDGFEMQFGVNHLGHFALTVRLLPLLTATAGSRVVTMSSMGHRAGRMHFDDLMFDRGYSRWQAYFQSKLANLLFTAELQRRLAASGTSTIALAAHPGGSRTDLGTEGRGLSNRLMAAVVPLVTQSAATGALPLLRAATDPAASGGQFYGPRWLAVGHPVLETPAPAARRTADARRLWTESVRLTGVDADLPVAR